MFPIHVELYQEERFHHRLIQSLGLDINRKLQTGAIDEKEVDQWRGEGHGCPKSAEMVKAGSQQTNTKSEEVYDIRLMFASLCFKMKYVCLFFEKYN